ncbi:MAG: efflux RND transporter permease subunit [Muribaculaceae bacterium]|nr:efflux RND transporter permease subunit [Muribaculaceae bacterium]
MLNKIIRFSLDNRLIVLLCSALVVVLGIFSLARTEVDIFPDLNAPTVVVMTEAQGYAPEEVEKIVTFPIETAVNGATGVRRVRSSSSSGFSIVWVEFDWSTDVYKARQIVSEKLSAIANDFPPGVNAPTLGPQSSILGEMLIIGLTSDTTSMTELRSIADRNIRPRLLSIGGVSQVAVLGGDIKEYQIQISPERMKHFDVTLDDVDAAVEGINNNASGGIINEYGNEYIVKGDVNTTSLEDISKSVIKSTESGIVTIGDIADVVEGCKRPKLGTASLNVKPAVLLTVTKQPSVGTINLTEKIESELAELKTTLPSDVNVRTDIFRQSDFIDTSIGNLGEALIEGALFVILILFIFLMNPRTTAISVVALPVSILITIIAMHLMGLGINTMSLGGIAIAIGSLVDDAIVDVENVYKRLCLNRQSGTPLPARDIIYEASAEVRLPIFNSSLIIIASFVPLFFLTGVEGRLLIPLGIAFIVALIASTLVALTLTPVLCSYLLEKKKSGKQKSSESKVVSVLKSGLSRCLNWGLSHSRILLWSTAGLFVLSLVIFFTLGRSFLPSFNEGSLTINVSTLPGISLEESDKIGREAEKIILSMPEISTVSRRTGRAELEEHALGVNVSELDAPYKLEGRTRNEMVRELRAKLSEIPGTNIEIGQPISHRIDAMLSGAESQIVIKIFGDDLNRLYSLGQSVKSTMKKIEGVVDVNVEQQVSRPQIDIRPRREMMARFGIKASDFQKFVNLVVGGEVVSQVYEDGLPYDLAVRVSDEQRSTINQISALTIDSNIGKIPLSYVADIVSTAGPNTINRENVSRRLLISANVDGRDLRGAVNEIKEEIEKDVKLPEGYFITYGGQFESEANASRTLAIASMGAILVIFLLLFHEFRNLRHSSIILLNMPLAMIGGIVILRLTSGELNIPAIIGFISLLGICTRNGMLLISRYNHYRREGESLYNSVIKGSLDRLSPIMMTALTSALALVPIALRSGEPGNEIQSPLAIVILGGLVSATILNLIITPTVYYLIERRNENK